jgi:5-methylthioadenosine/S-adenosylhomocysteine deaminase
MSNNDTAEPTVIANCTAITMDPELRVLSPAWISISDGMITRIASTPDVHASGRVIDGSGKVLIPGIVNAHTHLWQTLIRGKYELMPFNDWLAAIYACRDHLTPDDCRTSAQLGGLESLRSGVTTVVDHQFLHRGSDLAHGAIEGLLDVGIRSVVARTIMDEGAIVPATACETAEAGLDSVTELLTHYKDLRARGLLTVMTGPNTPGVSASIDLAQATISFCRDNGIRQSMHLAESPTVREAVRKRFGSDGVIQWLAAGDALGPETLAAHCVDLTPADIAVLAEHRVSVAHNPVSNLFLADGIAPVAEMLAAGVVVGLGTDGAASNNSQDMFEVTKMATLLQRARTGRADILEPMRSLQLATLDSARAVGIDHLVGSIEVGKRGDLVLIDLQRGVHNVAVHDPVSALIHTARPCDVDTVLVDGRVLLEDGKATNIDEPGLLVKAQEAGESLIRKL